MIRRLCIIGVGLIGGSVARAVRARGLCSEIVGVDRDPSNLARAEELGVIDRGFRSVEEGAEGSDWVFVATPVGAIGSVLAELKLAWNLDAIYTDAGSTKGNIVAALNALFGATPPNFVPGHPIAGAERSGVEASSEALYAGKRVILTPLANTDAGKLDSVEAFWNAIGARVSRMDPDHHDAVLAATSHLPHVLAFTLVHMLGRKDEQEEIFQYAAGGFRDFTRIASSDPTMWLDICMANREQIAPLIRQLQQELESVNQLLSREASGELLSFFMDARQARQRFLDQLEK
ncbi:prephenate dehydrogenase [Methyloterricola oryzae]|uniref:prephenate dehydrogenase n=1 Tax=Methyloterricola oryzae TaxID=1495050 RepID=UPI0005EB6611|nr:prephenate dehydrogenase/arogenate dehydrogenase family protein [Methyloterricola oryzae]